MGQQRGDLKRKSSRNWNINPRGFRLQGGTRGKGGNDIRKEGEKKACKNEQV